VTPLLWLPRGARRLAGLFSFQAPAVATAAAGKAGGDKRACGGHISAETRVNERIRAPEVRLVGPKGEQIGIVSINEALRLAQEADLDLVEVATTARPPVAKLMDYGKFKYESAVKARESRKNQTQTIVKEIKLRPKIDPHDYGTKKGHVERFLKAGDKVKVTGRRRQRAWLRRVPAEAGRAEHDHGDRPAPEEDRGQGRTQRTGCHAAAAGSQPAQRGGPGADRRVKV
jgi:translation initiation factor IF-3